MCFAKKIFVIEFVSPYYEKIIKLAMACIGLLKIHLGAGGIFLKI